MASAFSRNQQRLAPREGYDVAFCHNCFHEWYLNVGATSPPPPCPRCEAEVVEIVEQDTENDPRGFQQPGGLPMFAEVLMGLSGLGSMARPGNRSGSQMSDAGLDNHGNRTENSHDGRDRNAPYNPFSNPGDPVHMHGITQEEIDQLHDLNNSLDDDDDDDYDDLYDDPDEADIDEEEYHGPNNLYMYRTTQRFDAANPDSQASSGDGSIPQTRGARQEAAQPQQEPQDPQNPPRRTPAADPADPNAMINTFLQFMHGLSDGNRTGRSGPETLFSGGGANNDGGQPGAPRVTTTQRHQTTTINTNFGTTRFTIATGPLQRDGTGNFNTVFANIMGNLGPPNVDGQNNQNNQNRRGPGANGGNGTLPPFHDALQNLLAMIVGQGAAAYNGDAVHSDEALDRIITMLMENNRGPTGAPPAAQSALDALERKKVDAKMLEPDGHAECTICITEVNLGEEILFLPCKHWFHEECVVTWLRQHNTCPVCRHAIAAETANSGANANANTNANANSNTPNNAPGATQAGAAGQQPRPQQPPLPRNMSDFIRSRGISIPPTNPEDPTHLDNRRRMHQQLHQARLNAIRASANLPPENGPAGPFGPFGAFSRSPAGSPFTGSPFNGSPFNIPSPSPTPPTGAGSNNTTPSSSHNASHYRSSRVPEREAAAERERRRRDSHSPVSGHPTATTTSSSTSTGSSSTRHRFNWSSQNYRLREQREQREQQQREQQREHQAHISAWMDYDEESPNQSQGQQGQTQTQSGTGSNGSSHYFWYSSMGPTHSGMPNNRRNSSNATDPSPGGAFDGAGDRAAHINIQLPGLTSMFAGNAGGVDPSSGGNESHSSHNAGNDQNSNNNNGGGGGFFSNLFRGLGGGNASSSTRRRS